MIISYKALSRLLTRAVPIKELILAIENSGIEIESIYTILNKLDTNIIFARLEQIVDEPTLLAVRKCLVDIGGDETVSIICGAKNIEVGQMVIVAKPGAMISDGIIIKEKKIAGHTSHGMICALDEIGLKGQDYDGVFIVDEKKQNKINVGDKLSDLDYTYSDIFPDHDIYIDISTPSNRIDLLSYNGLAYDIVAHINDCDYNPLIKTADNKYLEYIKEDSGSNGYIRFSPEIAGCPTLSLRLNIKEPLNKYKLGGYYQNLLQSAGINSHNIMVDISNVIMLITGQPSHFFDAAKIEGDYIYVDKLRKEDEAKDFVAINGNTYNIGVGSLILKDSSKVVALAGISGSINSIVDDNTRSVIFESIIWPMENIRKTSRKTGLITEASKRYQRGLSPLVLREDVLPLMFELLKEANVDYEILDNSIFISDIRQYNIPAINVSLPWLKQFLAVANIDKNNIRKLEKSGFLVSFTETDSVDITPPSHRNDIENRYDLAEEIIKIIGFDSIIEASLEIDNNLDLMQTPFYFQSYLKKSLNLLGYSEVYYDSLVSTNSDNGIELLNPISQEKPYLRSDDNTLGYNIVAANILARGLYCFDLSKVFYYDKKDNIVEDLQLTIIVSASSGASQYLSNSISSLFRSLGIEHISCLQDGADFKVVDNNSNLIATISEHLYFSNKGKRTYSQVVIAHSQLFDYYLKQLNNKNYNFNLAKSSTIKRDITVKLPVDTIWINWKNQLETRIGHVHCYYLDTFIKSNSDGYKFVTFEIVFNLDKIPVSDIDKIISDII